MRVSKQWNRFLREVADGASARKIPNAGKHLRSCWMRFWATWRNWRCPCSLQRSWSRWFFKGPIQPKLFYESIRKLNELSPGHARTVSLVGHLDLLDTTCLQPFWGKHAGIHEKAYAVHNTVCRMHDDAVLLKQCNPMALCALLLLAK